MVQSASFVAVDRGSDSKTLLAVGDRSGYNVDNEPAHLLVYEINEANGAVELRHAGTLDGIRGAVNDIAFEKDRNVLLACGRDSFIRRWQLPSLAPLEPIDVGAMKNSADGWYRLGTSNRIPSNLMSCSSRSPRDWWITRRRGWRRVVRRGNVTANRNSSREQQIARNFAARERLAVGFDDGQILVCDTATVKDERASFLLRRLVAHASAIHDTAFDQEGRQLFSASADTTLKVWSVDEDLKPGAETKQNVLPEMVFTSAMRWLRDGRRIVSAQATDQPMLRLWDRATGKRLQTCPVPQATIRDRLMHRF